MSQKPKMDLLRKGKKSSRTSEVADVQQVSSEVPTPVNPVPFQPTVAVTLKSKKTKKSTTDPDSVHITSQGSAIISDDSDRLKIVSNSGVITQVSNPSESGQLVSNASVLSSESTTDSEGNITSKVTTSDGLTVITIHKVDGSIVSSSTKSDISVYDSVTGVATSTQGSTKTTTGLGISVLSDDTQTMASQGSKVSTTQGPTTTTVDTTSGVVSVVDTDSNTITSTDAMGNQTIKSLTTGQKTVKDVSTGLTSTFDATGKLLSAVPTVTTSSVIETAGTLAAKSAVDAANLAAIATKPGDDTLAFVKKYAPKLLTMLKDPTKLMATLALISGSIMLVQGLDVKSLLAKSNKKLTKSAGVDKKASDQAGKKAKSKARRIYERVMENVQQAFTAMTTAIKNAATHEKQILEQKWASLKKAYLNLLKDAKDAWKAIVDLFSATKDLIQAKWKAATAPRVKVPSRGSASTQDRITAANKIREESVKKAQQAIEMAKLVKKASEAFSKATTTLTRLAGAIVLAIANVVNMAAGLITYVMSMGLAITTSGVGFLASVPGAVIKGFTTA